ncbi:dihydropteroate synthase-like protein [Methanocrinis sp.]|uniref:dihydropteroate synthase-like protein n=1 Tax=Methanocrinis sp. TaxID=3101522 RepID=UPI003D12097C
MRALVVTGRLAEEMVREAVGEMADVLVMEVDVASFITPKMLREARPEGYDIILIPGAITADFGPVSCELETKIRLGPKHAVDLRRVLPLLDSVELSATTPACVLLEERMRSEARSAVDELEQDAKASMAIKGVKVGGSSRMKVLAEIVDATRFGDLGLAERVRRSELEGADMIDLGIPLDADPADVARAVRTALGATRLPVSVDTLRPELLNAGIGAGCDLILSLDGSNLNEVGETAASAGVFAVVLPGPETSLAENLRRALARGVKAMADPVLSPPLMGLAESICRYREFHLAFPEVPLFFGVGNVAELLDADSQGVNALLAAIGAEAGASVLFTPEYSDKARGSIRELRTASEMMLLAKARDSPPKDLGLDLLVLKEKHRRPEVEMPAEFETVGPGVGRGEDGGVGGGGGGGRWEMDPAGSFRIGVAEGKIVVRHDSATLVGISARELLAEIIDRGLVTRLDHAGYLGRELERAETALSLGRSYSQDESLFPTKN